MDAVDVSTVRTEQYRFDDEASLLESFLAPSRAAVGIKGDLDSFKLYKLFSRIFRRF